MLLAKLAGQFQEYDAFPPIWSSQGDLVQKPVRRLCFPLIFKELTFFSFKIRL